MFGRKTGPCVRYSYGCLPPIQGGDLADEQFRLAHRYRNKLCEIERVRRAALEAILLQDLAVAECATTAQALKDSLQEQRDRLSTLRQQTRTPDPHGTEALTEEIEATRTQLRSAWVALKAARKGAFAQTWVKAAIDQANAVALTASKEARSTSGLYWGTYGTVEQAAQKWRSSHTPPQFERYKGEGTLGVQCQKGMPLEELAGDDTRVRIDPIDWERRAVAPRPEQKRLSHTRLYLRIGSDGRAPVWLVVPIVMHRPLPQGSRIKWVHLIRTKIADRFHYDVQFTVELAQSPTPIAKCKGSVAIDFGWRLLADGLRVAYWRDDAGQEGQLLLSPKHLAQFHQVAELRSIRDQHFNAARDALAATLDRTMLPEWLAKATETLRQWRSPERLDALFRQWRLLRYQDDVSAFVVLETWYHKHRHLWQWEANLLAKAIGHRREMYRLFAREMATGYTEVRIEGFDLRRMAKRPAPEEGTAGSQAGRTYRQMAAVSTLHMALKEQCAKSGAALVEVKAAGSTQRCNECGSIHHIDFGKQVWWTCPKCGALHDQDANASANLLVAEAAQ